jgi:hypothetical protein
MFEPQRPCAAGASSPVFQRGKLQRDRVAVSISINDLSNHVGDVSLRST